MNFKHLDNKEIKVPIRVYNVETKELIKVTESIYEATKLTGLRDGSIRSHIKLKTRLKPEKNKLGLLLCFR